MAGITGLWLMWIFSELYYAKIWPSSFASLNSYPTTFSEAIRCAMRAGDSPGGTRLRAIDAIDQQHRNT